MILGSEFQKSILIRILHFQDTMCVDSVKTDNFDFFGPNLPKKEIRIWNSEN